MHEARGSRRARIYEILEWTRDEDRAARIFNLSILVLILANVTALAAWSMPSIRESHSNAFRTFEIISIAVFSIEYGLRLWSCPSDSRFSHPIIGRLRFATRILPLIDLLAILPFFFTVMHCDLRFLRALRLLLVAKLFRSSQTMRIFANAILQQRKELLGAAFLLAVFLVVSASAMYFAETGAHPNAFLSIPDSLWWSVITMTTVGYGDTVPVTTMGRLLGSFIAILGVLTIAIPSGIFSVGFIEAYRNEMAKPSLCQHCGKLPTHLPITAST